MELSLRSSKNSTDVTSFINITLLSTLPTLQSLTDFCFIDNTLEIYRNTSWLNLFIFVAYNISHLKTNFKQKIRDLKLFLFINDIHSNMVYDNCYISDVYSNIIKHFIHGIIYIISNQDFYNDKSNYFSLIDLFILIYQFEKKTVVSQSTREIKELLFPLKKALKETSDQYETTNTNLYHFYFRFLFTNKSYNNISSVFYNKNEVFSNNNSNDSNNHLQLAITINSESEKPILNLSNDNSNMILKPTWLLQNSEQSLTSTNIDSLIGEINLIKPKKNNLNCLMRLIKESVNLHKSLANFYNIYYYEDSQFKLQLIGSNTFGLNTLQSKMDFILIPKLNTREITLNGIINWMKYKAMNKDNFIYNFNTFGKNQINKENDKILFSFTPNDNKTEGVLYLINEKNIKCNELIKKIFFQEPLASQLHLFLKPLMVLETGIDLIFLIFGFFHSKNSLFNAEIKMLNYNKSKFNVNNIVIKDYDYGYYYDINIAKLNKMQFNTKIDTLILNFPVVLPFVISINYKWEL